MAQKKLTSDDHSSNPQFSTINYCAIRRTNRGIYRWRNFNLRRRDQSARPNPLCQRHRQLQNPAVDDRRWPRVLFAVGGIARRHGINRPMFLSRRIVDPAGADRDFHRGDNCRQSARTRYHVRLFRSRQPTLEFSVAHGCRSCHFRRTARACGQVGE